FSLPEDAKTSGFRTLGVDAHCHSETLPRDKFGGRFQSENRLLTWDGPLGVVQYSCRCKCFAIGGVTPMTAAFRPQRTGLPRNIFFAILPGPTRKRSASPYCYRLTYESQEPLIPGCAMLWEVYGGRTTYQVALERDVTGELRWHCTCADHVYRGEQDEPH